MQEPLGILYIASALRKAGYDVDFVDLTFADSLDVLRDKVSNADLIAMSATTALFGRAREVLEYIRAINKDVPAIIGGPHATTLPFDALKAGFDYAVIGEGEETTAELVDAIGNDKNISLIRGIAFKEKGSPKLTEPRPFIENIDAIPFPARDLLDYEKYFAAGLDTVGIMAMRGCPYNCLFCKPMQNKLFGNKIRRRSVSNVVDEIEQIQKAYGGRKLFFKDDTLTTNGAGWFEEFGDELKRRNLDIDDWVCQSRVNQVSFELLKKLKETGCRSISFGVESGSQKILNFYRKGITVEQTIKAFDMCHELGFWTHAYIMLGAPPETRDDLEMTLQLLKRIKPSSISASITTPAPGTDLYLYAEENSILNIKDYVENDYYSTKMPMKLAHLTEADLDEYKRKIDGFVFGQRIASAFSSFSELGRAVKTAMHQPAKFASFLKKI